MIFFKHQLEIGRFIVRWIFINMMNYFIITQVSSNKTFYDKAVFHNIAFTIRHWVLWQKSCSICPISSVSYKSAGAGFSSLKRDAAFKAAKLLIALSCAFSFRTTVQAMRLFLFAPPIMEITGIRTKSRLILPPPLWVEVTTAVNAFISVVWINHKPILPHDALYCKISARRLAQEVLL